MYEKIEELARNAGKIILSGMGKINNVDEKSSNADIVTEYDVMVQDFLEKELSKLYPCAKFLGEEGDSKENVKEILSGTAFIIDPIDGTTNFVRNFYKSAVSIAMLQNGKVVYGCCYIPYSDELFCAETGKGAFLNGKSIKCSNRDIRHSIASVGTTPYNKELGEATFGIMRAFFETAMDIRRFGSAVIDILDVACGKSDIFCEMRLSPWDYAAAGLIASEAGAIVTDMKGNRLGYDGRCSVVVATKPCIEFFRTSPEIQKYKDLF